jgi:hypothetical protein
VRNASVERTNCGVPKRSSKSTRAPFTRARKISSALSRAASCS